MYTDEILTDEGSGCDLIAIYRKIVRGKLLGEIINEYERKTYKRKIKKESTLVDLLDE